MADPWDEYAAAASAPAATPESQEGPWADYAPAAAPQPQVSPISIEGGKIAQQSFDAMTAKIDQAFQQQSLSAVFKARAAQEFKAGGLLNDLAAIGNGFGAMVAGVPESIWDFMKLPGDVYTGKQPVDESVIPRTAFAAMMTGGDIGSPHPSATPEPVGAENPAATLAEAKDLGVVGPPKPDTTGLPPKEAAEQAVPPPRAMAAGRADETISGPAPQQNPWQQRFSQFVDKLDTADDVKQLIRDAAKENGDFMPARQGDIPLSQVESIADAAGILPEEIDRRGLGRLLRNDGEVRTAMQLMLQVTDKVNDAARAVRADDSPENLIALQESIMRRDLAVEQVVGLRAEWGRTGRVFQEFMQNVKDQEALGDFLKDKGRTPDDLRDIADTITGLNDPSQVARYMNDLRTPSAWDKYLFYWVNALISGPVTHAKYIGANAAFAGYEAGVVTPIAGAIGTARRAITGGDEGVFAGEAASRLWGLLAGTPDALRASWRAARENIQVPLPGEVAQNINPVINQKPNPIGGLAGTVIGVPSRMATGIHSFFNFLGWRANQEAEAYRAAVKEGLSPVQDTFWQRQQALASDVNALEKVSPGATQRSIDNGYKLTFIGEPGAFGQWMQQVTSKRFKFPFTDAEWQPLKLIMPFVHIPGQILRSGLEQTPAAFLDERMRGDILGKNGAVAQDTAIARLVAGGAVSAMVANWALNDRITGYGPTDPNERAIWLRNHEPYSVRLGNWWVSYNKFGPIGDLVGVIANLIDVGANVEGSKYDEAAFRLTKATSRLLEDEVGMQGLVNLIEAMDDDHKAARFLSGQAASNLPYSSLLRQSASLTDPYMREAKTFVDQLRYAMPWARQELLPKRDAITGEPLTNPGYATILRQRAANADPLDAELSRLQIKPGAPEDRIGGVKLTPELYDRYQATAGPLAKMTLDAMLRSPGWFTLPDYVRETAIRHAITGARETAAAAMQARYPELIAAGIQQRVDHITGAAHTSRPKDTPAALQGVQP